MDGIRKSEKASQAWKYYIMGFDQQQIGEKVGVSQSTVCQWFKEEMEMRAIERKELSFHFIEGELARLDRLMNMCMEDIREDVVVVRSNPEGNPEGGAGGIKVHKEVIKRVDKQMVDRVLKIQEARAKYLGLYAPEKVEVTAKSLEEIILASMKPGLLDQFKAKRLVDVTAVEVKDD